MTKRDDRPSIGSRLAARTGAGRSSDYSDGRAPRKAKHDNRATDRPARRDAQGAYWNAVPRDIEWTLVHEETTRPMFTPEQWRVLVATWVVVDGYTDKPALSVPPKGRTSRVLLHGHEGSDAERRRLTDAIRDCRDRAERIASDLFHVWRPAAQHQDARRRARAGEALTGHEALLAEQPLSEDERRILQRWKRPRVGRKGNASDPLSIGHEETPGPRVAFNYDDDSAADYLHGNG